MTHTETEVTNMAFKNPLDLAQDLQYEPFKLDREKYPDVEETPYGFIYNVNGRSITDQNAMARKFGFGNGSGWTLNTPDNDESYYETFDEAYQAAKKYK